MRVLQQVLSPGVQHAKKADLGSEMFGVGGNLEQGRGTGNETGDRR